LLCSTGWFGTCFVDQAGLKLIIFLSQPPSSWDCRHVLLHPGFLGLFNEPETFACDNLSWVSVTCNRKNLIGMSSDNQTMDLCIIHDSLCYCFKFLKRLYLLVL
jgi:hypothetical protein